MTNEPQSPTKKRLLAYEKHKDSWSDFFAKKDLKKPYYSPSEIHELFRWVVNKVCNIQFDIEDLRQTYVIQQTEDIVDDPVVSADEKYSPAKVFKEIVFDVLDTQNALTIEEICAKAEIHRDTVLKALSDLGQERRAFETKPGLWLRV